LSIDSHALIALARPSTPDELREEVIERAANGEAISHKEVTRLIEEGAPKIRRLRLRNCNAASTPSAPRRPTEKVSDTVGISTFFHLDSRGNRHPKSTSAV